MDKTWKLASWNVCGLCEPNRKTVVSNWIKSHTLSFDFLALQEIKADRFRLDIALRAILPTFLKFVSAPVDGKGGTALLVRPSLKVIDSGALDFGRAVWIRIEGDSGSFGVVNIYAPNSPRDRAILWRDLCETLPMENWILCGNFNMIEDKIDASGVSSIIKGRELECWRALKTRFEFIDVLHLKGEYGGAHFTWRRNRMQVLVQSRLDRCYVAKGGWWTGHELSITHDGGSALSDHDPIILTFNSAQNGPPRREYGKIALFKANPSVLRNRDNMRQLKQAWEEGTADCRDPLLAFVKPSIKLRQKLIERQNAPIKREEEF